MKEHPFINLPIQEVEQYSLIIPINELPFWQKKGWKTYKEINLPEGDEEAYMLYGDLNLETETLIFNQPEAITDVNASRLIGRKITAVKTHIGTYGMGGPGYFGLLLDDDEYLVYTVWSADRYVRFNDENQVIEASISDYKLDKHALTIHIDNGEEIIYDFKVDYVFDEDSEEEKPDDISEYLYFKLKEANFIV